jgi:hypothetical protein
VVVGEDAAIQLELGQKGMRADIARDQDRAHDVPGKSNPLAGDLNVAGQIRGTPAFYVVEKGGGIGLWGFREDNEWYHLDSLDWAPEEESALREYRGR